MTYSLTRAIAAILIGIALWFAPLGSATAQQGGEESSTETLGDAASDAVVPAIEVYQHYNQRHGRYFMGWQFTVDEAKTISQLGAHDANRNGKLDNVGSTSVALFDVDSEALLAAAQIPAATEPVDGFAYVELDQRVTVIPGRTYLVAAEVSGEPYAYGGQITYGPGINYAGYAYKIETVPALPNHRGSGGNNYYGATFRVDAITTPIIDDPGRLISSLNTELSVDLTVKGPEATALTWSATNLPSGLTINPTTGQITGAATSVETVAATVTVTSDEGASDSIEIYWSVLDSQTPDITEITRIVALEGARVSIEIEAEDDDGALIFTADGLPEGLRIDPDSGLITGTALEAGSHVVSVTATDILGLNSTETFELAVVAVGASPAIESYTEYTVGIGRYFMGWQFTVDEEKTISELGVHDSNRDGVLDNVGSTTVALFDRETKELLGRVEVSRFAETEDGFAYAKLIEPVVAVPGKAYVVAAEASGEGYAYGGIVNAADGVNIVGYAYKVGSDFGWPNRLGLSDNSYFGATFRIETLPTPLLADPGTQASPLDEPVSLTMTIEESDGVQPAWSASGLPSGLTIDPATGEISGSPDTVGTSMVTISATNDFGLTGEVQFTWSVLGQFEPTISPIDSSTVVETDEISIQASSDVVGPATYSAVGLPEGLSIDENSGLISGRAQPDGVYDVTVTATDGLGRSDSTGFQLTVLNWGVSPAITSYNDYLTRVGNYYMGWQFTVDEAMTITELGIHDSNRDGIIRNREATTVGIYNKDTGRPIADVLVPINAVVDDGFAYSPLAEPVVVEPGTTYIVAAQSAGEPYAYSGTLELSPGINYAGYAYRSGSEPGWPYYHGTSGPYYFGATFRTSEPRPQIP